MVQYDCPYIRTSKSHDVAFRTQHWEFNQANRTLETRLLTIGEDSEELHSALEALNSCEMLQDYDLLSRKRNTALLRSRIDETDAMRTIRKNGGYVTGPFVIRNGSEIWNVGFDRGQAAGDALSELDRSNEFSIKSDDSVHIDDFFDILQNVESLGSLLRTLQSLTDRERETLETAVEDGYFATPRGTTLDGIGEEFDISRMGASKNLRRSQRKVLRKVIHVLNDVEAQMELQEEGPETQELDE
ncbi:helix-turn-helix domain-containing protein [Natronomonas pharaonis]|nr:helix-turn-helix domain-containing protein [Natronomonas pharaonis]